MEPYLVRRLGRLLELVGRFLVVMLLFRVFLPSTGTKLLFEKLTVEKVGLLSVAAAGVGFKFSNRTTL